MDFFLTRAKLAFVADAADVITLAVFAPHLSKVSWMTATLAAQAVASIVADSCARGRFTAVHVSGLVVSLGALALWPQVSRVTQANSAFQCAIAVMTGRASRLGRVLAWTVACVIDGHLQCIFKSQRLDDECMTLLCRTASERCFYTERHLNDRHRDTLLFEYIIVTICPRFGIKVWLQWF